jgi:hypothetical protein
MAGVSLDTAILGWHGLEGDRRFALRRAADKSGFPWLTASRLPELLLYKPLRQAEGESKYPTHVLTPDGRELELDGEELQIELAQKHGSAVELMRFNHGIFDEAPVSIMINLDPATAEKDTRVTKAAVGLNGNHAGVYATVICVGELAVGQRVYLR